MRRGRRRHHEPLGEAGAEALFRGPSHGRGGLADRKKDQAAAPRRLGDARDHEAPAHHAKILTDEAAGFGGLEGRREDA
jgi:hypothetical protein